jgi:hypothetical protein
LAKSEFQQVGKGNEDIEDEGTNLDEQECQGGVMSDSLTRRVKRMAEKSNSAQQLPSFEFKEGTYQLP